MKKKLPKITSLKYHKKTDNKQPFYEVTVLTEHDKGYSLCGEMCEGFFQILYKRAKKDKAKITRLKSKRILAIAHL